MRIVRKAENVLLVFALVVFLFSGCGSATSGFTSGNVARGASVTDTSESPAGMGVGDIMLANLAGDEVVLDFEDVNSNAKFILITGTSNTSSGGEFKVASYLSADLEKSIGVESGWDPDKHVNNEEDDYEPDEIFSAWLRAAEEELAYLEPLPEVSMGKSVSPKRYVSVGDVKSFKVIASITSPGNYVTVKARARYVGDEVAFFVDTRIREDIFSDDDIKEQAEMFDDIAAREQDLLGSVSDVNGDGLITVLITPQINRLAGYHGGSISGYFYAADLYSPTKINRGRNHQEILFALAPDPDGRYGTMISREFYTEYVLPSVLPHELQHAINYNQHVFENGGRPEKAWLNEGLSHLIEDIMGYGMGNSLRYANFLANTAMTSLVTSRSPNIRERGAIYLFLRYLYEQAGDGDRFLRSLLDTDKRGIANLEAAFNGSDSDFDQFPEFVRRWTVAIAMSNRGISSDHRYTYRPREIEPESGNWKGVLISGDVGNGWGTVLNGVCLKDISEYSDFLLAPSSAKYYNVDKIPATIIIKASSSDNFAVLIRTE